MAFNSRLLKWLTGVRITISLLSFPPALGYELNAKPELAEDPVSIVGQMEEAYERINDYEAVFTKQARFDGRLSQEETIQFCFKKPFMVYMKWLKDPHKGQEVVYVQGENENRLKAHKGGMLSFVVVSLRPESPRAMKGSHHPVTDAGIGKLIELVGSEVRRATEREELIWRSLGCWEFDGRPSYKLEAVFPGNREAGYYCHRAVLWMDCELMVPVQVMIYDWDNSLYEKFAYRKLRTNVGIADSRFQL